MLDTLAPFIEKNNKNALPVAKQTPGSVENSNLVTEANIISFG